MTATIRPHTKIQYYSLSLSFTPFHGSWSPILSWISPLFSPSRILTMSASILALAPVY